MRMILCQRGHEKRKGASGAIIEQFGPLLPLPGGYLWMGLDSKGEAGK